MLRAAWSTVGVLEASSYCVLSGLEGTVYALTRYVKVPTHAPAGIGLLAVSGPRIFPPSSPRTARENSVEGTKVERLPLFTCASGRTNLPYISDDPESSTLHSSRCSPQFISSTIHDRDACL